MINRPIRTEGEYKAALVEIEKFFSDEPKKGTTEADRFDLLALLIEAYEDQYYQIPPPNPVQSFLYYLESRGFLRQ